MSWPDPIRLVCSGTFRSNQPLPRRSLLSLTQGSDRPVHSSMPLHIGVRRIGKTPMILTSNKNCAEFGRKKTAMATVYSALSLNRSTRFSLTIRPPCTGFGWLPRDGPQLCHCSRLSSERLVSILSPAPSGTSKVRYCFSFDRLLHLEFIEADTSRASQRCDNSSTPRTTWVRNFSAGTYSGCLHASAFWNSEDNRPSFFDFFE